MSSPMPLQIGKKVQIGQGQPLTLFSGPCVIESLDHTLQCAEMLLSIVRNRPIQLVFKASYDKANRTSYNSFRGPGLEEGLKILETVKNTFDIPVVSDIHEEEEVSSARDVLDVLQIPAFLCRQTDLIVACAKTGLPLHIKKGQFMAPWDMANVLNKARSQQNSSVILCDRGTTFGYGNLVVDMRSFQIMRELGAYVSFDASHAVQLPGALGSQTDGQRHFIPLLARAAVAAGLDALFIETHPEPKMAKSDSTNVFPLHELGRLLDSLLAFHELAQNDSFLNAYESLQ